MTAGSDLLDPATAPGSAAARVRRLRKRAAADEQDHFFEEALAALAEAQGVAAAAGLVTEAAALGADVARLQTIVETAVNYQGFFPVDGAFTLGGGFSVAAEVFEKLHEHQREGLRFLWAVYSRGEDDVGAMLADDMGLGKTIQIISFLRSLFEERFIRNVLLVMPINVLENWKREFATWFPKMRVKVCRGKTAMQDMAVVKKKGGIAMINYELLRSKIAQVNEPSDFKWDYVILDEGHYIKNPASLIFRALSTVKTKQRILLSGTPVQNNLMEFHTLFTWICNERLLGSVRDFKVKYALPISNGSERDASDAEKVLGKELAEELRRIVAPFFLRREKVEVFKDKRKSSSSAAKPATTSSTTASPRVPEQGKKQKPGIDGRKRDLIVWVTLSPYQIELYNSFLHTPQVREILNTSRSPLAAITILKKICNHPMLLSKELVMCHNMNFGSSDASGVQSHKLETLVELARHLKAQGHRTLIFSQSTKILNSIEARLCAESIRFRRIDGSMNSSADRQREITDFNGNEDITCFLLTTKIGIGITLTGADTVIIYDVSWNPADDAQAVDRAYRVGQKKDVTVFRFITCGTVEEKIYRNQIKKGYLSNSATKTGADFKYFRKSELRDLFTLDDPKVSKTQQYLCELHPINEKENHAHFKHFFDLVPRLEHVSGVSQHDALFKIADETHVDDELLQKVKEMSLGLEKLGGGGKATRRVKRIVKDTPAKPKPPADLEEMIAQLGGTTLDASFDDTDECPTGTHTIKNVKVNRCRCVCTSDEMRRYAVLTTRASLFIARDKLKEAYSALTEARDLCNDDAGVHFALEYLRTQNLNV